MHRLHKMNRCFDGPFGPLTVHLLTIVAVDVWSKTLLNDRAAACLWKRCIGFVRAADVGLLAGPSWSLVGEVVVGCGLGDRRRDKSTLKNCQDWPKNLGNSTNSYDVANLSKKGKKYPQILTMPYR